MKRKYCTVIFINVLAIFILCLKVHGRLFKAVTNICVVILKISIPSTQPLMQLCCYILEYISLEGSF